MVRLRSSLHAAERGEARGQTDRVTVYVQVGSIGAASCAAQHSVWHQFPSALPSPALPSLTCTCPRPCHHTGHHHHHRARSRHGHACHPGTAPPARHGMAGHSSGGTSFRNGVCTVSKHGKHRVPPPGLRTAQVTRTLPPEPYLLNLNQKPNSPNLYTPSP